MSAGENDPARRNTVRMMEIGLGLHRYATEHDGVFPDNLDVLFDKGYLQPPLEPKSLISGRPYVYTAAGERGSLKMRDCRLVLIYDDDSTAGYHQCYFAFGSGGGVGVDELKEQLKQRGR